MRGLGSDVSSIAWVHSSGTEIGNVWVAAGQKVVRRVFRNVVAHRIYRPQILLFSLDASVMIQNTSHSLVSLDGIIDPDDVFNEVTVFGAAPEGSD